MFFSLENNKYAEKMKHFTLKTDTFTPSNLHTFTPCNSFNGFCSSSRLGSGVGGGLAAGNRPLTEDTICNVLHSLNGLFSGIVCTVCVTQFLHFLPFQSIDTRDSC